MILEAVFDSDSDEEQEARKAASRFTSSLTRRVADDGTVRRTATLPGEGLLELRLYRIANVLDVSPLERSQHAAVKLTYQVDFSSPELALINDFLKSVKKKFTEEGKFFADKKFNKK